MQPEEQLGRRIRSLREAAGLSLRSLASRSGLSMNAISRIERGESSPTVASLHRLASSLSVSIASLFDDPEAPGGVLVRRDQRLRAEGKGVVLESLSAGTLGRHFDPYLITLDPGASSAPGPVSHPGEEFIHCLQGTIECQIGDTWETLSPGDSLLFRADQPHVCRNNGVGFASALLVLERQPNGKPMRDYHLAF